jgi:glycosyltransferase involved in cell wall biosynthesis
MRVHVVDPSAFTPPYDHALCAALARAGADVELVTSRFAYGTAPPPDGYRLSELFYRHAVGQPGSRLRLASKLLEHVPDMLAYRRRAEEAQIVHFQWLAVQPIDRYLLPRRPVVLTAHDLLPREPRPMQLRAQRRLYEAVDAVIAHSEYGRLRLVDELGVEEAKVRVIHHGAFHYLASGPAGALPGELSGSGGPVVLFFGLLRPYKGIEVLLEAWRQIEAGQLWIVGRPRMAIDSLRTQSPPRVSWVTRFVSDDQLRACFRRAEMIVLPYTRTDRFDFSGVLATAMAFGKPIIVSDVGGFSEVAQAGAARLVPPGDAAALADALSSLLADPESRKRLGRAAAAAAQGAYSWSHAAELTLDLYGEFAR